MRVPSWLCFRSCTACEIVLCCRVVALQAASALPDTLGDRLFFENEKGFKKRVDAQGERLLGLVGRLMEQVNLRMGTLTDAG